MKSRLVVVDCASEDVCVGELRLSESDCSAEAVLTAGLSGALKLDFSCGSVVSACRLTCPGFCKIIKVTNLSFCKD